MPLAIRLEAGDAVLGELRDRVGQQADRLQQVDRSSLA